MSDPAAVVEFGALVWRWESETKACAWLGRTSATVELSFRVANRDRVTRTGELQVVADIAIERRENDDGGPRSARGQFDLCARWRHEFDSLGDLRESMDPDIGYICSRMRSMEGVELPW